MRCDLFHLCFALPEALDGQTHHALSAAIYDGHVDYVLGEVTTGTRSCPLSIRLL